MHGCVRGLRYRISGQGAYGRLRRPRSPVKSLAVTNLVSKRQAEVRKLHGQGRSQLEIALELGIGPTTVAREERALGLTRARGRPAGSKTSPPAASTKHLLMEARQAKAEARTAAKAKLEQRIVERYLDPDEPSVEKIGSEVGVTGQTAWRTLVRAGVQLRSTGRRPGVPAGPTPEQTRAKISAAQKQAYESDRGEQRRLEHHERMTRSWEEGVGAAPATLRVKAHGRTRQVYFGRWSGPKGGAAGIDAGKEKGGRPAEMTPEQQQQIFELEDAGLSTRQISEIVFGDRKFHMRVYRFLRR